MKYRVIDFLTEDRFFLLGDYDDEEQIEYLRNFINESFEFDGDVKSLGILLEAPVINRIASVYLSNKTIEEVISLQNRGLPKPEPIGRLQFTLRSDGRTLIEKLW